MEASGSRLDDSKGVLLVKHAVVIPKAQNFSSGHLAQAAVTFVVTY